MVADISDKEGGLWPPDVCQYTYMIVLQKGIGSMLSLSHTAGTSFRR